MQTHAPGAPCCEARCASDSAEPAPTVPMEALGGDLVDQSCQELHSPSTPATFTAKTPPVPRGGNEPQGWRANEQSVGSKGDVELGSN